MEAKRNIKRIENIHISKDSEYKRIKCFDSESRLIKSLRFKDEKLLYKLTVTYDDIKQIKITKVKEFKSSSIIKSKSIFDNQTNIGYNFKKIINTENNQTENNYFFIEPTLNNSVLINENKKIDFIYSLKGILIHLTLSEHNDKNQLVKLYTFENKINESDPKIVLNESAIYDKYPDLKIMLEKFNFNIFNERISNDLDITNFVRLKEYEYEDDKLLKSIEKVVCEEELENEDLDFFITNEETFDASGMVIESFSEGCGNSEFSIPVITTFEPSEKKYNTKNQLIEEIEKNYSETIHTKYKYEGVRLKSEIITTISHKRFDKFGNYFPETRDIITSVFENIFDEYENIIEITRKYLDEESNELIISRKEYNKIEYW